MCAHFLLLTLLGGRTNSSSLEIPVIRITISNLSKPCNHVSLYSPSTSFSCSLSICITVLFVGLALLAAFLSYYGHLVIFSRKSLIFRSQQNSFCILFNQSNLDQFHEYVSISFTFLVYRLCRAVPFHQFSLSLCHSLVLLGFVLWKFIQCGASINTCSLCNLTSSALQSLHIL